VPASATTYPEGVLELFKESVLARCRAAGYPEFAWWIPLVMEASALLGAVVAVGQRADGHLLPAAALIAVALTPWLSDVVRRPLPWPVFTVVVVSATAATAVLYPVNYDFAMFVMVMLAGHLGATVRLGRGLAAVVAMCVLLKGLAMLGLLDGSGFWIAALVIGWDVGFVMQYQQRRLEEEHRAQETRQAQAVLEERQRIAREVHDVIAHSLSVTMLHLTAARRALEEDGADDVDEAIAALRDAERLGRQAMTDIRHTVGLLGQDGGERTAAAPDLADVPALVEQFRAAGLDVALALHGDSSRVPPTTGLGVYRIVQESLANIAKHQPRAPATVHLDAEGTGLHLTVSNDVAAPPVRQPGGSGLDGMRQRADLLGAAFSAGPRDGRWVVELSLPRQRGDRRQLTCPLSARGAQAVRT